jgi:hypothetical protein
MDTVPDSQARKGRNFNLRAYIAGGSATAALIAGTVIAFAALATYVGFNGVPLGDDDVAATEVVVETDSPEAAVAALASAPAAVEPTPAAPTAIAPAPGSASGAGGSVASSRAAGGPAPAAEVPASVAPSNPDASNPDAPAPTIGSGSVPSVVGGGAPEEIENPGPGIGAELPVGAPDASTPVDDAISDLGGAVGAPDLEGPAGGVGDDLGGG